MPKVKSVEKGTKVYVTPQGDEIIVRKVAQPILRAIKPTTPKPVRPMIEMKIAGGTDTQKRPMKQGDEGWEEFQEDLELWNTEKSTLSNAVELVLAVGFDIYVDPAQSITLLESDVKALSFTKTTQVMLDAGLVTLPDNSWLAKEMWVEDHYVTPHDTIQIQWLLMELNNTPKEVIDNIKASFQRSVQGEDSGELDGGDQ